MLDRIRSYMKGLTEAGWGDADLKMAAQNVIGLIDSGLEDRAVNQALNTCVMAGKQMERTIIFELIVEREKDEDRSARGSPGS